jgi:hypothetical protein
VLNGRDKLQRLSVPVIYFDIRAGMSETTPGHLSSLKLRESLYT